MKILYMYVYFVGTDTQNDGLNSYMHHQDTEMIKKLFQS